MSHDVVQLWACCRCGDTFRSEKAAKQHQGKRVREPTTPLSALLAGFWFIGQISDLPLSDLEYFLPQNISFLRTLSDF